jgi:hypothetical protein
MLRRQRVRHVHLFGRHAREVAAPFGGADEERVAQHVHRLLLFALDIDAAGRAERVGQRAEGDLARDRLAGQRDIGDERVQVAGGARMASAFLDQELGKRGFSSGGHGSLLESVLVLGIDYRHCQSVQ